MQKKRLSNCRVSLTILGESLVETTDCLCFLLQVAGERVELEAGKAICFQEICWDVTKIGQFLQICNSIADKFKSVSRPQSCSSAFLTG